MLRKLMESVIPGYVRDERGWKIKTRLLTYHPVSYGTATLARLSIGFSSEGRRLMLHYFPVQDFASTYHDHPWSFWTVILKGEYCDKSVDPDGGIHYEMMQRGTCRHRQAFHRHQTRVILPTVTLVLTSPTVREWCEGDPTEWVCGGVATDFNETLGHIPQYR